MVASCWLLLAWYDLARSRHWREREGKALTRLTRQLGLTDLAIWTEARYTRHPSQADFFSAFQNFPGALEHFPAGSVLAPVRPVFPAPVRPSLIIPLREESDAHENP